MIHYPSRHVFYSFLHTLKNNRSRNSMKLISTTAIEKTYVGQINYLLSILYSSSIICLKSIILYLVGHFLKSFLHTLRTIWHILPTLYHKIPCSQMLKKHFVFFTSDVAHERQIKLRCPKKCTCFNKKQPMSLMFNLHSADRKFKPFYSTRNNSQRAIKYVQISLNTVIK